MTPPALPLTWRFRLVKPHTYPCNVPALYLGIKRCCNCLCKKNAKSLFERETCNLKSDLTLSRLFSPSFHACTFAQGYGPSIYCPPQSTEWYVSCPKLASVACSGLGLNQRGTPFC